MVRLLLSHGADPNARGALGRTPLMNAAEWHDPAAVELLLAAGADVRARDRWGASALDKASEEGRAEIVRILRQAAGHSPSPPYSGERGPKARASKRIRITVLASATRLTAPRD
jgi:ankyrin repeat protein